MVFKSPVVSLGGFRLREDKLNILVATRNRPKDISNLLESLIHQTNPNFFITIVDSSTDLLEETNAVISKYKKSMNINYHSTNKRGSCTQRNLGLDLIREYLVLISDDDCIFEPDTIEKLYEYLKENPDIALFGLNIKEERKPSKLKFIKKILGISNQSKNYIIRKNGINCTGSIYRDDLKVEWLPSGALVIVKSNIKDNNLLKFNTSLERFSGYCSAEDAYLTYSIYLKGYKLGLANKAIVHHFPSISSRDHDKLMYKVRTYNRFIVWHDLIFSQSKINFVPFIISNLIFTLQYSLFILKGNINPLTGHLNGLKEAYCFYKGKNQ